MSAKISNPINWRDWAERLFWTSLSAALGAGATAGLFGLAALKAGEVAGLTALVNAVLVLARYRLSILPTPGQAIVAQVQAQTARTPALAPRLVGDLGSPPPPAAA